MAYQSWDDLVGMSAKDPRLRLLGANQAQQPSQVSSTGVAQPASMSKQLNQSATQQPTQSPDGAMMAAIQKRMKRNQVDPNASPNYSGTPTPYAY